MNRLSQKLIGVAALLSMLLFSFALSAQNAQNKNSKAPAQTSTTQAQPTETLKVNLNIASEAELQKLPGIGPSKAQAIVEYRNKVGKFKQVAEIVKVRGIGRGILKRIQPMLTLEGPAITQ